mmetsp:Transcript_8181/g.14010  ORF Transcript_8181/g.14010 Transcript_8181/m.14010 type:complete len:115 (-) Transcript_8181:87-431(-)
MFDKTVTIPLPPVKPTPTLPPGDKCKPKLDITCASVDKESNGVNCNDLVPPDLACPAAPKSLTFAYLFDGKCLGPPPGPFPTDHGCTERLTDPEEVDVVRIFCFVNRVCLTVSQ